MRSCFLFLFNLFYVLVHLHQTLFVSRILKNRSPITLYLLNAKNEWSNYNEHVIAMEEEDWDENTIKEFSKLLERHEQAWKPAIEELETINIGNDQFKKS